MFFECFQSLCHSCCIVLVYSTTISRIRKFGQRDKWKDCTPTAIKMAETRSNDDTTSTPEPHSRLQGEGGLGRTEGRQDPGRAGSTVRCPSQPDHGLEDAVAGKCSGRVWRRQGRAAS